MDDVTTTGKVLPMVRRTPVASPKVETVELAEGERLVLVCKKCDCSTFQLRSDGQIECSMCDEFVEPDTVHYDWMKLAPDTPEPGAEVQEGGAVLNNCLPSATMARDRVTKRLLEWNKGKSTVLISVYNDDGAGMFWTGAETEDQREWIIRKLNEVIDTTKGRKL